MPPLRFVAALNAQRIIVLLAHSAAQHLLYFISVRSTRGTMRSCRSRKTIITEGVPTILHVADIQGDAMRLSPCLRRHATFSPRSPISHDVPHEPLPPTMSYVLSLLLHYSPTPKTGIRTRFRRKTHTHTHTHVVRKRSEPVHKCNA